jgi:hypothetical protein
MKLPCIFFAHLFTKELIIYLTKHPTAGVTGKGGKWREKLPDTESAFWGRFSESVGECPHLSDARGVIRMKLN